MVYCIYQKEKEKKTMTTLELIQLQNEHKDNFFTQGDDYEEKEEN